MLSRSRNADARPARTRSDLVGSTREMSSKRRGFRLKLYITAFSSSAKEISNSERYDSRHAPTPVALTKQPPSHILRGLRVPRRRRLRGAGDPLGEGHHPRAAFESDPSDFAPASVRFFTGDKSHPSDERNYWGRLSRPSHFRAEGRSANTRICDGVFENSV